MTEYIKREAALKIANRYGLDDGQALGRHSGIADCIANEIATIPSADVAEVRRGRWEIVQDDYELYTIRCSGCHDEWCFECGDDPDELNYHFCPNCGAKMAGEE